METWRKVWRDGMAPAMSTAALDGLLRGLKADDQRLLQGLTTSPPPMQSVLDWDVEGACPAGYAGWQGEGMQSVGEVEEYFARVCFYADEAIGEPAGVRYFLNWWDDNPRGTVVRELLAEVEASLLARRKG